jgi:hypothetical protein
MEAIDKILLFIHIAMGSISLLVFWIPVFTKKGGNLHNKAGMLYVYTMWIVVITAFILSVINFLQKGYITAAFLGFLTLLTGHPLWYAVTILKHKNQIPVRLLKIRKVILGLLVTSAAGLLIWSLILKVQGASILLLIFGIIGLTQLPLFLKSIKKSQEDGNWIAAHINGMISSGIAAYTAFFAFGGATFFGEIFSGPLNAIPWTLPSVIGTIFISREIRKRGFTGKAV